MVLMIFPRAVKVNWSFDAEAPSMFKARAGATEKGNNRRVNTIIETELKLMLASEASFWELHRALSAWVVPSRVEQTNVYFDTPDRELRRRRWMVRVRREDREDGAHFEVTAKDRVLTEEDALVSRERTDAITAEQARALLGMELSLTDLPTELSQSLADALGAPLYPVGAITNRRDSFTLPDGYVIELDRTTFPDGGVDHEIEIELRSDDQTLAGARAALAKAAPALDVDDLPPSPSKFQRFLEALDAVEQRALRVDD